MGLARRIIPALLILVLVLLAVGWFLLMLSDHKLLGSHARESLAFTSNIQYLSEAVYFDAGSHEKWLLHTWSLSVEWPIYLLYPLVLLGVKRVLPGPKPCLACTCWRCILSLADLYPAR